MGLVKARVCLGVWDEEALQLLSALPLGRSLQGKAAATSSGHSGNTWDNPQGEELKSPASSRLNKASEAQSQMLKILTAPDSAPGTCLPKDPRRENPLDKLLNYWYLKTVGYACCFELGQFILYNSE